MSESDDRTVVLTMLAKTGLEPSVEEIDRLVAGYPTTRAMLDMLYNIPGTRYEEPALTFDPRVAP